jgi:hypothetical protein
MIVKSWQAGFHPSEALVTVEMAPLVAAVAPALPPPQTIPLECRLGQGNWQPCTMTIVQLGEHWWLQVGRERLEFRSDGRGSLSLRGSKGPLRAVQPVWGSDQALCWDGVCAKGDLPLD